MTMDDGRIEAALKRSEQALDRIERALASRPSQAPRDDALRDTVRDAVRELDRIIRTQEG